MADLDINDPLELKDTMRTRLAALNGAYYTAARLNNMTRNDMVYALRDTASI